jgi:hypothetical protein
MVGLGGVANRRTAEFHTSTFEIPCSIFAFSASFETPVGRSLFLDQAGRFGGQRRR